MGEGTAYRYLLSLFGAILSGACLLAFVCFLQCHASASSVLLSFVSPNRLGRYSQASKQFAKAVEEVAAVVASVGLLPVECIRLCA